MRSTPPAKAARPACTAAYWPGCATHTTAASRSGSRSTPPGMAPRIPPRTPTRETPAPQDRPSVDLRDPVRCARHEQRLGERHPWLQAGRQGQRLLADPCHPATPLPDPLLPCHHPQPRAPIHRRDQGRPQPQLDQLTVPPDWLRHTGKIIEAHMDRPYTGTYQISQSDASVPS